MKASTSKIVKLTELVDVSFTLVSSKHVDIKTWPVLESVDIGTE